MQLNQYKNKPFNIIIVFANSNNLIILMGYFSISWISYDIALFPFNFYFKVTKKIFYIIIENTQKKIENFV